PEADEQVGTYADEFPENKHLNEIVREHDAEHREREQAQAGEVTAEATVLAHVAAGINVDQAANARDDQQHQPAERIDRDAELNLKIADDQPVERGAAEGRRKEQHTKAQHEGDR